MPRWFQTQNPPPVETTKKLLMPRDARCGTASVSSHYPTASVRGDKNNGYHTPFVRDLPDRTNRRTQFGNVINENTRQVAPTPMFKTPYKKSVEPTAHQAVAVSSNKTLRQTGKQPVAALSTPSNRRLNSDLSSRYEADSQREDEKTSDITRKGQELELTAAKENAHPVAEEVRNACYVVGISLCQVKWQGVLGQ